MFKSESKKRILLIDDHPLLRQGITQLINQQEDLIVCGEAEDQAGALKAVTDLAPDLAVVDISLKNGRGVDLIKDFKVRYPRLRILVLSMHDESLYAERVLRAGAHGYVMKREASEKVLEAIRFILHGGIYLNQQITGRILSKLTGQPAVSGKPGLDVLTDREVDVIMLIGKGHSVQQISDQLHISMKTIEAHRANLKLKLKLPSGSDLLQFAIRVAHETGEI